MITKHETRIGLIFLLISLFTGSCLGSGNMETDSQFTEIPKNPTLPPTWTLEVSPTLMSSPTPTFTSVPLSKLLSDENYALVEELLITNAGCKLPCWWGITPGVTRWDDAERFLKTFTLISSRIGSDENYYVDTTFFLPQQEYAPSHIFRVKEGIIESIEANPAHVTTYNLIDLLKEYGKPDEVYIYVLREMHQGAFPFGIDLFFKTKGILTSYFTEGEDMGDMIQGCFGKEKGTNLLMLWPPERNWTLDEVASKLVGHGLARLYTLEEVTGMDIEDFYQTFAGLESEGCITIPKERLE